MTLNQAKRFYDFAIGQITLDIYGNLAVRTLSGKLYGIPAESYYDRSHIGFMCVFWISKKSEKIKNVGICGDEPQQMTEAIVDYLWGVNYAEVNFA